MVQSRPPDVNVLPVGYRPPTITLKRAVTTLLAAAVVLGLIPAYTALSTARQATADKQGHLYILDAELATTQGNQASLAEMDAQISAAQSEVDDLRAASAAFDRQEVSRASGMDAAVKSILPRVHVQSMLQIDDTILLSGEAGSQALVLDYSSELMNSGQFANVRIISMVNADPLGLAPDVTFSIALED